jgi:hypothetical protein
MIWAAVSRRLARNELSRTSRTNVVRSTHHTACLPRAMPGVAACISCGAQVYSYVGLRLRL